MSNAIFNAAPMPYLRGIRDESRGLNVRDPEQLPTHLPHIYLYAEEGPTEPTFCDGNSLATIFGGKTIDPRHPYYNHQTVLANTVLGQGNGIFVQRVIPNDAGPKARILLSADILAKDVAQYQRDANGRFILNGEGQLVPVTGMGATVAGHAIKWVVNSWAAGEVTEAFGSVSTRTGTLSEGGEQSTLYPIMEFEVNFVGGYGNNIAIRLIAPTTTGDLPLNTDAVAAIKSYIYRMVILRRDSAEMNPNIVQTNNGDQWVDFSLRPDAVDLRRDFDYSFDRLIGEYEDMSAPGAETPIYGPFGRQYLYRENLELVLGLIAESEAELGLLPVSEMDGDSEYLYSINPFTGVNYDNVPYYSLQVVSAAQGGQRFSESSQVYAAGGSDGTMSNSAFDLLVRNELSNYGSTEWPLLDWAKFPMSVYYDTGFSLDTKFAFAVPMSRRKDVAVVIGTHTVGEAQLTPSEESSTAMSINNYFRNFPESTLYGTPVVRALIVGHSGKLISSSYRDFLPLTIEIANKFAGYMGAGSGFWRSTASFDQAPNNQLTMFDPRSVNVRWKPEQARYRDWDNGLVWVENYDRKALFFPAVQTVYNDDTSVLNAAVNMFIAVDLEKVAQRSWRELTGNSRYSDDQFLERSDEWIAGAVRGKYDDRAVIVPRTFYTAADRQRGYSWSCEIDMYVGTMKTASAFTIVAKRLSALNAAA